MCAGDWWQATYNPNTRVAGLAITRLALNLENEQLVYYRDEAGAKQQVMSGKAEMTTLLQYFKLNQQDATGFSKRACDLYYWQIPEQFYWTRNKECVSWQAQTSYP